MRHVLAELTAAAMVLVLAPALAAAAPFMEVEARVEAGGGAGAGPVVRIERIQFLRGSAAAVAADTLTIGCPSPDLLPWETVFQVGDTIPMTWTADARNKTGALELPRGGWIRSCRCGKRPATLAAPLFGSFVLDDGRVEGALRVASRGRAVQRFVPFWPSKSHPPRRVRMRFAWSQDAVAGR